MTYKTRLTKLSKNPNDLRTERVVGVCEDVPKYKAPFVMMSDSLTPGAELRIITTTPIIFIQPFHDIDGNPESYVFITESGSKYRLEIFP